MRIKSFQVYNHTVKISYVKKIKGNLLGNCDVNCLKLKIATKEIPESGIEHCRWHEQVHLMFKLLGRDELYEDEALVDGMAGMLAQYEQTKR
jgi:hypothetical protein